MKSMVFGAFLLIHLKTTNLTHFRVKIGGFYACTVVTATFLVIIKALLKPKTMYLRGSKSLFIKGGHYGSRDLGNQVTESLPLKMRVFGQIVHTSFGVFPPHRNVTFHLPPGKWAKNHPKMAPDHQIRWFSENRSVHFVHHFHPLGGGNAHFPLKSGRKRGYRGWIAKIGFTSNPGRPPQRGIFPSFTPFYLPSGRD
jgi:hypothetical protein